MDFGIIGFPTDYGIGVRDLARLVEDRGFESLFFPEHTHVPVDRRSPFPAGGDLPEPYRRNLDPFLAHAVAATVTERLKLGTGICLVAQRDPIVLATVVASLDHLSGGRVILGVGGGWNVEEMQNHGVDPNLRWAIVEDHVLAMRAIWAQDEASYGGTYTEFGPMWSWLKPIQKPHPPVLVGGTSATALERALAFGDGWIPALDLDKPLAPLLARIESFKHLCEERGRNVAPVTVAMGYGRAALPSEVRLLRAASVDRCLLSVPTASYADTVAALDAAVPLATTP